MNELEKEIVNTLSDTTEGLDFETIQPEEDSPLNQAVKEKDIAKTNRESWNVWKPEQSKDSEQDTPTYQTIEEDNVPEQDIEGQTEPIVSQQEDDKPFEIPKETAKQSANALLGMANNMLEVGGGFIITIKKHKEFYDFDDVVTLIDQQNTKNIQRIKLDKEDKALLRPLIMSLLQEKAKTLSPTQQLMGAIVSILLKKAQIVMQVRAENTILVDRILNIIKEEKKEKQQETKTETIIEDKDTLSQEKDQAIQNDEYMQEEFYEDAIFPNDVLEVSDNKTIDDDKTT